MSAHATDDDRAGSSSPLAIKDPILAIKQELKRADVELRLRRHFHLEVCLRRNGEDSRLFLWVRLPGDVRRSRLEPPIRWKVFDARNASEVFAVASAIIEAALAERARAAEADLER